MTSVGLAAPGVAIRVEDKYFLKDPTSSELGRRIIGQSIVMLDEMGLETFTFRKLADRLATTEASVYRYFPNKQRLLLYLAAWYWSWMEYRVQIATANVADPVERLRRALRELTRPIERDDTVPDVDEAALYRVVVAESSKAYLTREVDADNREGLFRGYKRLCRGVAGIVAQIDPSYPYPVALVSTIVESSHMQRFFAQHLPSLTEVSSGPKGTSATEFLTDLAMRTLAVGGKRPRARAVSARDS